MDPFASMVEPIRIKDQFSLISGTKSIQDDTNIVSADDGGDDSDIAEPDPDDPDAIEDFEVRERIIAWERKALYVYKFQIKLIYIKWRNWGYSDSLFCSVLCIS